MPTVPPTAAQLSLAADPASGDAPLAVAFAPRVQYGRAPFPVSFLAMVKQGLSPVRWEFIAGDGEARDGTGKPPRFLGHTYSAPGVYRAVLILHLGQGDRLLTYVDVRVR